MAESLRSKFEEHLSCAICLEQLNDPKVLPCLHSYCHGCIAKLDMTNNVLTCPECRTTLEVPAPPDVSFLPSNFFAKNLLATLMLGAECDSENIVCENCDSGEHPETRCQQCTRYLCQFCTESHRRSRDSKGHILITLDELRESDAPVIAEAVRCQKHGDEVIKLYCKTCQETICRDCAIVDHRQHDYLFVRDVSQVKKDELLRLVGEVKQRRSEMAQSLEYLRKREEIVNGSNESTVQKIDEYFERLGSVVESKKNEFLEEATTIKNAKLKQFHLQQEKLELDLGSCDSSIEFTEQALKNGNDVQILNLAKYIAPCLESLKNKKPEISYPPCDNPLACTKELTEHINICDRMARFDFVKVNNRDNSDIHMYTANFSSPNQYLIVGEKSEILVRRKNSSTADKGRCQSTISPSFEGVAVRDVTIVDNGDGSHTVRFCPIHVGALTFVAYMNGSTRVPGCIKSKMVKKKNKIPNDCQIADRIFESGIHVWEIEIDHSDCYMSAQVDFEVGVIDYVNSNTACFDGYVKRYHEESVRFRLDMDKKELTMVPSWDGICNMIDLKSFRMVSPYFKSDCDDCKLTVLKGDWRLIGYE